MDFKEVEKKIEELNKIKPHSTNDNRDRYYRLRELLLNDGPEFSYTFEFWSRENPSVKYRIGVCIRGLPICKPIK